jgi:hypothetical protein
MSEARQASIDSMSLAPRENVMGEGATMRAESVGDGGGTGNGVT